MPYKLQVNLKDGLEELHTSHENEQVFLLHALEPSNLSTRYWKTALEDLDLGEGARLK